jgi:hypothetical protein
LKKRLLQIILCLFFSISYSQNIISLVQKDKSKITVTLRVNSVSPDSEEMQQTAEIKNIKTGKIQIIKNIETSITGRESHLEINDYNFDGYTDFAAFRTDDGMGVYTIYQIFIYNPTSGLFKELQLPTQFAAKCDEFCDIKINKQKKTLESSCRGGAQWHVDIWKFDKNKNLILTKK